MDKCMSINIVSLTVKHSIKFFTTASSGVKNLPEFLAVAMVDEVPIGHCDSNNATPEITQDWAKKVVEDDPQLLEWYTQSCLTARYTYKVDIDTFKQQHSQTEGK